MCEHIKIPFLADCSFKICGKPSKFSKSVCVVSDYADTHVFCEYLRENENVRETVLACSNRAQVVSLSKKVVKNLVTLSL